MAHGTDIASGSRSPLAEPGLQAASAAQATKAGQDPQSSDPQSSDPQSSGPQSADWQQAGTQPADKQPADKQPADKQQAGTQPADKQQAGTPPADPRQVDRNSADAQPVSKGEACIGLQATYCFLCSGIASWLSPAIMAAVVVIVVTRWFEPALPSDALTLTLTAAWALTVIAAINLTIRWGRVAVLPIALTAQLILVVAQFYYQVPGPGIFLLSNVLLASLLALPAAATLAAVFIGACGAALWLGGGTALAATTFTPFLLIQPAGFGFAFGWALRRSFVAQRQAEVLADRLGVMNEVLEENLRSAQELAATRERTRIAQELHDRLGHSLITTHLYLQVAQRSARSGASGQKADTDKVDAALEQANQTTKDALGELRNCVALLRDPEGYHSLSEAMHDLVERFPDSIFHTQLAITGTERRLNPMSEFALFRALQESLTNVARHSQANNVEVELHYTEDAVELVVADDGIGTDGAGDGVGLIGIRERLAAVGGSLAIESQQGAGYRLRARVA